MQRTNATFSFCFLGPCCVRLQRRSPADDRRPLSRVLPVQDRDEYHTGNRLESVYCHGGRARARGRERALYSRDRFGCRPQCAFVI